MPATAKPKRPPARRPPLAPKPYHHGDRWDEHPPPDPADAGDVEFDEVDLHLLEADGDRDVAQDMIQQGLARFPDSDNLRYEYIQPWLTRLARGTASKEVTAQAAKLTHSAGAVVRAGHSGVLDTPLSRI